MATPKSPQFKGKQQPEEPTTEFVMSPALSRAIAATTGFQSPEEQLNYLKAVRQRFNYQSKQKAGTLERALSD